MAICGACDEWYPADTSECTSCGGELVDERRPWRGHELRPDPYAAVEEVWSSADALAVLPDADSAPLSQARIAGLVRGFARVRARAAGRHAAPRSWLPDAPGVVAVALDAEHSRLEGSVGSDASWPELRDAREAILDLQAFLPDADADAAEACASDPALAGDERGKAALERIRWAQAIVVSMLRDDERVLGSHVALADHDITIGSAQQSLEAVDRYKSAQALGFGGMAVFPVSVGMGGIVGTILVGPTTSGIVACLALALAGVYLGLGYGWAVGTLASRLDRLAMRSGSTLFMRVGRTIGDLVTPAVFLGGPALAAVLTMVLFARLGLP